MVKSGSTLDLSDHFLVLSPTVFLTDMETLTMIERKIFRHISVCGLYLHGAIHAGNILLWLTSVTEEQGLISGANLNFPQGMAWSIQHETEIVKISQSNHHEKTVCIYWTKQLRPSLKLCALATVVTHWICQQTRCGNEHHASYTFLVPLAVFLDHPNPLPVRKVMKTVISPILYTAENWILDEGCLEPLGFQAEI